MKKQAKIVGRRATREIRTWNVGEVGLMGTRRVLADGSVVVGGSRGSAMARRTFRSELLLPYVGSIVVFHDMDRTDGRWAFFAAEWLVDGRVTPGKFICHAKPDDAKA